MTNFDWWYEDSTTYFIYRAYASLVLSGLFLAGVATVFEYHDPRILYDDCTFIIWFAGFGIVWDLFDDL